MYKFVIDTDSEKLSSVNVYADKDKTKRIAAPLDAVGRFAQTVEVAFIGSRKPSASDSLQLVVSWDGTIDSILQSSDETPQRAYIAHAGAPLDGEPDTWTFPVRFESAALEAALAKRSKITLRGAIVVENEAAGTHVEYHFSVGAAASIFAGAIADPQTAPIEFARVLRMSWADYQALDAIDPDVIYIVADAPGTDKLIENAIKNAGFVTPASIKSGIQTQSIMGYNGTQGRPTGNSLYLDGENMSLTSGGETIEFPTKPGTVALLSDLGGGSGEYATAEELAEEVNRAKAEEAGKVAYLSHTTGTATSQADGYGYRGTLRALGLYGGAVLIKSITITTRTGTNQNNNVALWARLLKVVDGAWVVAAQSKIARKWNEVGSNADLEFEMEPVEGVVPPSDDETIAIVWVNNKTAAATTSNGAISFQTNPIAGGLGGELPAAPTSGNTLSFSPVFKFRFAPLAGQDKLSERIAALEAKIAVIEAALSVATLSFPTGMSDYEVPYLTQHGTLVTVGTLPAASAGYVIHVLGVNRETLNATCEADWVSNVQTQASVFWDENTNKGCILFDVAQNYDAAPRSTTITLTSSALNEVYTIQITQAGA